MDNRASSAVTVPGKKAGPDALKKKGRGGRNKQTEGALLARATEELNARPAVIAQATAADDALMAREAGNWARSIPFTKPRAPYAPTGEAAAAGFPEPVDIPDDPDEFARLAARQLDGVLDEARDRVRAPGRPAP